MERGVLFFVPALKLFQDVVKSYCNVLSLFAWDSNAATYFECINSKHCLENAICISKRTFQTSLKHNLCHRASFISRDFICFCFWYAVFLSVFALFFFLKGSFKFSKTLRLERPAQCCVIYLLHENALVSHPWWISINASWIPPFIFIYGPRFYN